MLKEWLLLSRELMQNSGIFLYSPDFNPLEKAFAKVKAFLKSNKIAYQATNSAHLLVLMTYNTVSTEDSIGYITHAGYNIKACKT